MDVVSAKSDGEAQESKRRLGGPKGRGQEPEELWDEGGESEDEPEAQGAEETASDADEIDGRAELETDGRAELETAGPDEADEADEADEESRPAPEPGADEAPETREPAPSMGVPGAPTRVSAGVMFGLIGVAILISYLLD